MPSLTRAGFLPAAGSNTCFSSYSIAIDSYFSFLSAAVRPPLCPALNHEPGMSTLTFRSTCCCPGYCLKSKPAMPFRGDTGIGPIGTGSAQRQTPVWVEQGNRGVALHPDLSTTPTIPDLRFAEFRSTPEPSVVEDRSTGVSSSGKC